MEEKCWQLGGWVGGQAALADLPIALSRELKASRGCELWEQAAPQPQPTLCPPDWSRGKQNHFCCSPSSLQLGRTGRCLAGPEEGLCEWWPQVAQLALVSQLPGKIPLPSHPPSNTFHFQQLANTSTSQILSSRVNMS